MVPQLWRFYFFIDCTEMNKKEAKTVISQLQHFNAKRRCRQYRKINKTAKKTKYFSPRSFLKSPGEKIFKSYFINMRLHLNIQYIEQ